jgi:hypothetical protein
MLDELKRGTARLKLATLSIGSEIGGSGNAMTVTAAALDNWIRGGGRPQ